MTARMPSRSHLDNWPTFEWWSRAVNTYAQLTHGYCLADVVIEDGELPCWYMHQIPAWVVASALTTRLPRVRPTLVRFYTDREGITRELTRLRTRYNKNKAG